MKTFIIVISAIFLSVAAATVLVRPKKGLIEHRVREYELTEKYKNLQDSVADLEQKARILNRYLNMKHLEYIEVCNLVHTSKK